jgi:hypothetical protein
MTLPVYIFDTEAQALAALDLLHPAMAQIAAAAGYTVINGFHVVGKNAATGEDNPDDITTEWGSPMPLVGGGWGIRSIRKTFHTTYPQLEAAAGLSDPVDREIVREGVV